MFIYKLLLLGIHPAIAGAYVFLAKENTHNSPKIGPVAKQIEGSYLAMLCTAESILHPIMAALKPSNLLGKRMFEIWVPNLRAHGSG